MRSIGIAAFIVLACVGSAHAQAPHCDAAHVEVDGRCCRPGQLVENGRCVGVGSRAPARWETRWGIAISGLVLFVSGYGVGILGGLFSGDGGWWSDVAYYHPASCGHVEWTTFVPFLHGGQLLERDCYRPSESIALPAFIVLDATAHEIIGLVMMIVGLIGRRARARPVSFVPSLSPTQTGITIGGRF